MRTSLILIACTTVLCIAAGCSDDECTPCAPVVSEQPLAQIDLHAGGGTSSAVSDTMRIDFVSSSYDTLFDMYVTEADSGTVKVINAGKYPPFTDAAARLSDGVNDQWMFWARYVPDIGGGGSGTLESNHLNGGFTGEFNPDLLGAEITKIWLYINQVSIVQEGGYTTYDIDVCVVIMGTP